jgi:DNA repair exonuclease SbcCD ATPase subunit
MSGSKPLAIDLRHRPQTWRRAMKLREIKVQNFRCLADVTIPIGDTTVLVGANNSGKTALLDALRIALTGNRANRGILFDEYDYHMSKVGDIMYPENWTGN